MIASILKRLSAAETAGMCAAPLYHSLLLAAGKAVYQVEYLLPKTEDCSWCIWTLAEWRKKVCPKARHFGLTPILKNVDLTQKPYYTCLKY
jgi:hypothetical protein